jgi:hypothetical protein
MLQLSGNRSCPAIFFHPLPPVVLGCRNVNYDLTTGWTTGVRSPAGVKDFSSSLSVQTGSGAHPASYTMGTGGPFPGGKARPGRDADHSPRSSAEVESE